MFFLSDIEPLAMARTMACGDAEVVDCLEAEHGGLLKLLNFLCEYSDAEFIPAYLSMDRLFIGHKKDVIHVHYSFTDKTLTLCYYKAQNREVFKRAHGRVDDMFADVVDFLELYVTRHKRLKNRPQT